MKAQRLYLQQLYRSAGQHFPLQSFGVAAAAIACALVVQLGHLNFAYPFEQLLNDLLK